LKSTRKFEVSILGIITKKIPTIVSVENLNWVIEKSSENLVYRNLVPSAIFEEIYAILRKGDDTCRRFFHITNLQGNSKRKGHKLSYSQVSLANGTLILGVGQQSKMKKLR